MKKLVLIAFIGVLSLFAADFSKLSDSDFIKRAGSVPVADEPDYIIEMNKRAENKIVKESMEFRKAIREQQEKVLSKLSDEQKKKRAVDICKAIQSKLDTMTGKEIRESGLMPIKDCERPHHEGGCCGSKHKHGCGKDKEEGGCCGNKHGEGDGNKGCCGKDKPAPKKP